MTLRSDQLPLSEDAATVRLLIEGMHDADMDLGWDTIGAMLELARKYDVLDIRRNCMRKHATLPLTVDILPRALHLAATYGVDELASRCQAAIAKGATFDKVTRYLVTLETAWMYLLSVASVHPALTWQLQECISLGHKQAASAMCHTKLICLQEAWRYLVA